MTPSESDNSSKSKKAKWDRIVLKVSGEAFAGKAGFGIDGDIVGEIAEEILNRIKAADLFDEKTKEDIDLNQHNAWSMIGEENSYHTMHCHNEGSFDGISTLVYLEVPGTNIEDEPENNLFLATYVGPKNSYYYENTPTLDINPEVGKLLIFPDWLPHGTYPQTKGIRQTFNIDYRIVRANKKDKSKNFSYN